MTLKEVDAEVIVFDGGNVDNPPILPPDGLIWRSILTSKLHIYNDINPDIGLTLTRSAMHSHSFICPVRGCTGEFSRAKAKKKVLVPRTQEKYRPKKRHEAQFVPPPKSAISTFDDGGQ